MITPSQLHSILKVNGANMHADDDVIRSILLSSRYNKDEVDAAIMILRENPVTKETKVDGLHKVFRTDENLTPKEISDLLGIQVTMDDLPSRQQKNREISNVHSFIVWTLAFMVAAAGLLLYMYYYSIGVFHPAAGIF